MIGCSCKQCKQSFYIIISNHAKHLTPLHFSPSATNFHYSDASTRYYYLSFFHSFILTFQKSAPLLMLMITSNSWYATLGGWQEGRYSTSNHPHPYIPHVPYILYRPSSSLPLPCLPSHVPSPVLLCTALSCPTPSSCVSMFTVYTGSSCQHG